MSSDPRPVALLRLSLTDPEAGGRAILALNPPDWARWALLAAAVLASVVLLYLLPTLMGETTGLPSPFAFAGFQGVLNVVVVAVIAHAGRMFGGTGTFSQALWLMGWLQALTVALLAVQVLAAIVLPVLSLPVAMAAVVASIWVLVGYVCALHGFRSRLMVLLAGVGVFMAVSLLLSIVLVFLGIEPPGVANV